jgi:hypothetical protein
LLQHDENRGIKLQLDLQRKIGEKKRTKKRTHKEDLNHHEEEEEEEAKFWS